MGTVGKQPPAKYYSLIRSGRKQLETETSGWEQMCAAIAQIMQSA